MFLKHLEIYGFKSFADKTRVEFSDGITALLGPNGCGKSNVVDAVKWALGEQATKALRAEKMEDVIFNGTETRKAVNVAEVVLTLANDAGLLPLDVPEIEIKRRLYRSGESEYFINSAAVRLKEIRELFWDTGVGKTAYSVMEQGKIDQILSSKPDDRRYLFEEAAGITRFKVKGQEAERKLQRTEENMRQIEGILGEVKRSYESLKVQSEKTMKYRALKDENFQYELDIQLLRLKNFRYEKDEINESLKKKNADRDKLSAEMDSLNQKLEENLDLVNVLQGRLAEYQKNIYGFAVEKNAREKEVRLLTEQRSDTKAKISQNEGREKQAEGKIEELISDAKEQDDVVQDLLEKVAGIDENIKSFEENIKIAASRIEENDDAVKNAENDIRRLDKDREAHEKNLEAITDDIVASLDAGLKEAGYSATERRNSEAVISETFTRLKAIISARETLLRDLSASADRGTSGGPLPQAKELKHMSDNLAAALSEAAKLTDTLIESFSNYKKSTPAFLDDFLAPEGIITKKRAIDAEIRSCRDGVTEKRELIASLRKSNEDLNSRIDEYRATLEELRLNRMRMATQAQAAEEQARLIRRELSGQENLLKTLRDELFLDRKRLEEIDERISAAEAEIVEIKNKEKEAAENLEKLTKDISVKNTDVAGKQETIKKRMIELTKVQQSLEKTNMELVQNETEIKNIKDNFRETHSRDLMEFEERIFKITTPSQELREKLAAGRQALRDLGSVNLAAPEEFAEAEERYSFLSGQLADLNKARSDLENLTSEIRTESSALFMETYNKIRKNFHNMFRRLFGGGQGLLRLTDPNHVLESGVEIFAQPPGKKLENINLLSGGERSMTAVALLFATYMVKPSPFCLLDEIDAALDDQNVSRFIQILKEFGSSSQFIVVTHNKKTVTGAQTLLGVTMEESGVSKLISVRLSKTAYTGSTAEASSRPEQTDEDKSQMDFWDEDFVEEEVEMEEGRQLPPGIDDPAKVSEELLRPIRAGRKN